MLDYVDAYRELQFYSSSPHFMLVHASISDEPETSSGDRACCSCYPRRLQCSLEQRCVRLEEPSPLKHKKQWNSGYTPILPTLHKLKQTSHASIAEAYSGGPFLEKIIEVRAVVYVYFSCRRRKR